MRVKCLAQEHNTVSSARAQTSTARFGGLRTSHEPTTPPHIHESGGWSNLPLERLRSRFGDLTTNDKPRFAVSGFRLAVCPYLGLKIGWLNSRLPCLFSFVRSLLF